MKQLGDIIERMKTLSKKIEESLQKNNLDEAKILIDAYSEYTNNAELYNYKCAYYFQKGDLNRAENILLEGVKKHPFNFEININLGIIYEQLENYKTSIMYYVNAIKYSRSIEEKDQAIKSFERISSKIASNPNTNISELKSELKKYSSVLNEVDGRVYPLDEYGKSLIRHVIQKGTNDEYMVNMYKSHNVEDIDNGTRLFFKTELIKGKESAGEFIIILNKPSIIPLSLIHPNTKVDFSINNNNYQFNENHFTYNKYHYIRVEQAGRLKIKSSKSIFIGNPIELYDEPKKTKMVLKIFVDGLSYKFVEQHGIENVMPNTKKFFNSGVIAENCFATSEWTLPSKASINTGKYATRHKLLHPSFIYDFEKENKMMAEYYKEEGYFTTKICSNWRTTPRFGYYKGFDRILYQNFLGGMDARDVITETIEHLESFHDKNNYVSISLMDLHNVPDQIEDTLFGQTNTDISIRLNDSSIGETSVLTYYDKNKIEKYKLELQRVDLFLGILYDYLTKNYKQDEFLVVLHSDHGQTFLEEDKNLLHESRRKIPLMITGTNVPSTEVGELIEAVDILPSMLKLSSLTIPDDLDGRVPICFNGDIERNFVMTQILHPDQPYKACVEDNDQVYYFEADEKVENDLTFKFSGLKSKVVNKNKLRNDESIRKGKLIEYENHIFEQIKDFIK